MLQYSTVCNTAHYRQLQRLAKECSYTCHTVRSWTPQTTTYLGPTKSIQEASARWM